MKAILLAAAAVFFVVSAQANPSCAARPFLSWKRLAKTSVRPASLWGWGTVPWSRCSSTSTPGAWTTIVTCPDGVTCVAAAGEAFERVEKAASATMLGSLVTRAALNHVTSRHLQHQVGRPASFHLNEVHLDLSIIG
ncbi:hypothetical protein ACX9MO_12320 [Pseudooceanicola sp. 502str34]